MPYRYLALSLTCALALSACALTHPAPSFPNSPAPAARPAPAGSAQPAPGTPAPQQPEAAPAPGEKPYTPPPRQFHLGAAATALVAQAHQQSAGGDYGQAAATLERALRIEPDNPLLWTELGRVRMGENDPAQAESMGRKALALATGDPAAQSSAWHLIADSLRARGRNGEAADADRRSAQAAPHAS
jgi:tetratricopeptide (TPR) repeat protein